MSVLRFNRGPAWRDSVRLRLLCRGRSEMVETGQPFAPTVFRRLVGKAYAGLDGRRDVDAGGTRTCPQQTAERQPPARVDDRGYACPFPRCPDPTSCAQ